MNLAVRRPVFAYALGRPGSFALGATGATGPTGSTANQNIQQGCAQLDDTDASSYDNSTMASSAQSCGQAMLLNSSLGQQISSGLSNIIATALKESAELAAEGVGLYVALEAVIAVIGETVVSDLLIALVTAIANEIAAIVAAIAAEVGITVATTTAAGAASFGYVGAIIGFIIGATIGLVQYIELIDMSIEITNGGTYKVTDYAQTNLQNAATWLTQQTTLAGITPLYFSNIADLFLANPMWLWANQKLTGMCQPVPPGDLGSGDGVDFIFTQTPGAFELLSRAQYAEACWVVATTPSKLPFYWSVPQSTGQKPTDNPLNNPNNYNPVFSEADLYGAQAWTPDNPAADTYFGTTGGFNPDTDSESFVWPLRQAALNPTTIDASACTPSGSATTSSDTGIAVASGNTNQGGYAPYYYSSCPNLCTNNNTTDSSGKINGQTNIAKGIYALQVMYPALTVNQCLMIFNANYTAYVQWIGQATDWANAQCTPPTAATMGTGSQWNLEQSDIDIIAKNWTYPASCLSTAQTVALAWANTQCPKPAPSEVVSKFPPMTTQEAEQMLTLWSYNNNGNTVCGASTATTVVKTTAAVIGAGAVGVSALALQSGTSLGEALSRIVSAARGWVRL